VNNNLQFFETYLKEAKTSDPSDNNILILHGHGQGWQFTATHEVKVSIAEFAKSIEKNGIKFKFLGLDSNMMATLESLFALRNCADYIVATQTHMSAAGLVAPRFLKRIDESKDLSLLLSSLIDEAIEHTVVGPSTPTDFVLIETQHIGDLQELIRSFELTAQDFKKQHRVQGEVGVLYDLYSTVNECERLSASKKAWFQNIFDKVVKKARQSAVPYNPSLHGISIINSSEIKDKKSLDWKNYLSLPVEDEDKNLLKSSKSSESKH